MDKGVQVIYNISCKGFEKFVDIMKINRLLFTKVIMVINFIYT
jgi:hypothetical protein